MTTKNKISKLAFFTQLLKDPDRKSLFIIFYELTILLFMYREVPIHYFSRYLFKKEMKNFRDYLPNNFFDKKIKPVFNDSSVKEVLDNKLYFDMFFGKLTISIPKLMMFNNRNMFVIGDRGASVKHINDFKHLLKEIFDQELTNSIFIKKTLASSGGANIYKLTLQEFIENNEVVDKIYSEVINSEYLFQKTVKQHTDLNKLSDSSINTIRIDTFIDKDGNIDVISAYLRMSIANAHVDNISLGGCYVGINMETGTLMKNGYSTIDMLGVTVLTEHPLNKTVFEGFSIPCFDQVIALVKKAASFMPGLRLIGWDVAIEETGPVLIEGNYDYEIRGNDFIAGGYRVNPVFRKALIEIKYISG